MFRLMRKVLLHHWVLADLYVSLSDEPYMNLVCSERCNPVDDLSLKMWVPSETKNINLMIFNTITSKSEANTVVKHISCSSKCKFKSTSCKSNRKWNNETCQHECINYSTCKKRLWFETSTFICENGKYLKSIVDV